MGEGSARGWIFPLFRAGTPQAVPGVAGRRRRGRGEGADFFLLQQGEQTPLHFANAFPVTVS